MISKIRPCNDIGLKNIRVAVSAQCNLNCAYCDGPKSRTKSKPGAMEDFRKKPLSKGVIKTADYLNLIQGLYNAGFRGITLTGGEPMLNKNWAFIVTRSKEMGFQRVEMTTNGTLLARYLQKNGCFPKELTLLKISLDTHDPKEFKKLTRHGSLKSIIDGVKKLKKTNPDLPIRANRVLLKSELKDIKNYLAFIKSIGIDQVNFLDLILSNPKNYQQRKFFTQEYVCVPKIITILTKIYGNALSFKEGRYGYSVVFPTGLVAILKDSNGLTLRDHLCLHCSSYCQEGLFTVRVNTDGTMSPCYDHFAQLPFIDGIKELETGTFQNKANALMKRLVKAKPENVFQDFLSKHGLII